MTQPATSVEHYIKFYPAYDKRSPDPRTSYGIHGVELGLYIKGELGAGQFILSTNWQLPHVLEEQMASPDRSDIAIRCRFHPMPVDLGYHSPVPRYDSQMAMADCHILGGTCYYDGSTLNAEPVYQLLVEQGSDAVWDFLFNYYRQIFGELR